MADQQITGRAEAFQRDYLAWTALHHFLPAELIRELAIATLAEVCPTIALEDLFDEAMSPAPSAIASWALAPCTVADPLHDFLQQHVRALAWSNDAEISPRRSTLEESDPGPAQWISAAVSLGRFDFGSTPRRIEHLGLPENHSIFRLGSALTKAISANSEGPQGQWSHVHADLEAVPSPLRALAFKHFGDLCADADDWIRASDFYERAESAVSDFEAPWSELGEQLGDTISLSRASAAWVRSGPGAAADWLGRTMASAGHDPHRLATLNGSHDALVAALKTPNAKDWTDIRSTVMYPPLLVQSFDTGSALDSWLRGKYPQAHRHFWSVLRRQIALGSIAEVKVTKAAYGRALIDEASDRPDSKFDPEAFELGTRLLLESGQTETAARATFSPLTVARYVGADLVEDLSARVERHEGCRLERTLVFFELLAKWAAALETDQKALARQLLLHIVSKTRGQAATFETSQNAGGRGLKSLFEVAVARPEFRGAIAAEVLDLVIDHLIHPGWWTGKSDALKLAVQYRDVWSETQLRQVLEVIINLFAKQDGEARVAFVSREALSFLLTHEAMEAARGDAALGKRFFTEVLNFSLSQDGESINTLFNVAAFEKDLALSEEDAGKIAIVIDKVAKQATMTNASNATDAIRALFAASAQVGLSGITSAAENLVAILKSGPRSLPPFPYAYGPLIDLARGGRKIVERAGGTLPEFLPVLTQIGDALAGAWQAIAQNPSRLAAFSLPPSETPNPTLVRNWSIATVEFAKLLPDASRLCAALDEAEGVAALASTVRVARVLGSSVVWDDDSLGAMTAESSTAFYQSLGHRLNSAQQAPAELALKVVAALFAGVLQKGPRELDLAVFAVANAAPADLAVDLSALDAYLRRLAANAALERTIGPSAYALRLALRGDSEVGEAF